MTNTKSYVAMEQHQCPVCGSVFDTGSILLDRRLREVFPDTGAVTGHSLCAKCEDLKKRGYIAAIVCSNGEEESGDSIKNEDAHRTGEVIHIREEAAVNLFNVPVKLDDHPFVFISQEAADEVKRIYAKYVPNEPLDNPHEL